MIADGAELIGVIIFFSIGLTDADLKRMGTIPEDSEG